MAQSRAAAVPADVTQLLERWRLGDQQAFDLATAAVYPELRRIARAYLRRERTGHTLQPTALVHEAFLRLTSAGQLRFESRRQFYALAAQLMRRILVDHARALGARKRGGPDAVKVPLDGLEPGQPLPVQQFLELHDAMDRLAELNPRKAQVIELRYFGGLTLEETAETLEISTATAHREQRLAEAWLTDLLSR
jgi:RNA polymerase sigma factor (TIGR02999 family)